MSLEFPPSYSNFLTDHRIDELFIDRINPPIFGGIIGTQKQVEYQTKVKTFIHYKTESGLRYASGPVLSSNPLHI